MSNFKWPAIKIAGAEKGKQETSLLHLKNDFNNEGQRIAEVEDVSNEGQR